MKQPNIIFYFTDQQRWDTLGCYGQTLPVTPCLDALAADGVRFANAYTCQPVCGPARACLQSGLYATQVGCITNAVSLPTDTRTLAHYFAQAGYDTAYVGKWHLASDLDKNHYETSAVPPERRGGYRHWMAADVLEFTSHGYDGYVFDAQSRRVDFCGYRADCINGFAIDYLRSRPKDRPFFLFVSQLEPHHQNDRHRFEGPCGSAQKFSGYTVPPDLAGTGGDWRENFAEYLGQCSRLDENVGRLVQVLQEEGLWDDTILLYTSDHGCHFQTRTPDYKRSCHDSSIHVPLIMHGPGLARGCVRDEMVSLIDLPPTLLQFAGIPVPAQFQGHSVSALASGQTCDWPQDSVFLQISENEVGRALRTPEWKYAVKGDGDGWRDAYCDVYHEEYLYHLPSDPGERVNLAGDPTLAAVRGMLAQKLEAHILAAEGRRARIEL